MKGAVHGYPFCLFGITEIADIGKKGAGRGITIVADPFWRYLLGRVKTTLLSIFIKEVKVFTVGLGYVYLVSVIVVGVVIVDVGMGLRFGDVV